MSPLESIQNVTQPIDQLVESPFSDDEVEQIAIAVRAKYRQAASAVDTLFRYKTGRAGAQALGYPEEQLDQLSDALLSGFCGVGNPFRLGEVKPGSAVLDIGCGGGVDLLLAAHQVGDSGRVCGVDVTPEMIARAGGFVTESGLGNVELCEVSDGVLPFQVDSFDLVISNGVINLSAKKGELFKEIYRVLKAGGVLQFADIILLKPLPPTMAGKIHTWAD